MNDKALRIVPWSYALGDVVRKAVGISAMAVWFLTSHQPTIAADPAPPPLPDEMEDPGTPPPVMPLPAPSGVRPEMRTQPEAILHPRAGIPPNQPAAGMPFDRTLEQKNASPPTAPPARSIPDPPHAPAGSP
jgi:hypothetical protein